MGPLDHPKLRLQDWIAGTRAWILKVLLLRQHTEQKNTLESVTFSLKICSHQSLVTTQQTSGAPLQPIMSIWFQNMHYYFAHKSRLRLMSFHGSLNGKSSSLTSIFKPASQGQGTYPSKSYICWSRTQVDFFVIPDRNFMRKVWWVGTCGGQLGRAVQRWQ